MIGNSLNRVCNTWAVGFLNNSVKCITVYTYVTCHMEKPASLHIRCFQFLEKSMAIQNQLKCQPTLTFW